MVENTDRGTASRVGRTLIPVGASLALAVALMLIFGRTDVVPEPSATPAPAATSRSDAMPSLTLSAGPAGHLTVIVSNPPDGAIEVNAACVTSAGASLDVSAAATRDGGEAQASLGLPDGAITCTVTASNISGVDDRVPFVSADFARN
jgi:hypothetical protein